MSRDKPTLRTIRLLQLLESNPNGLRVKDIAEQINAPPRTVYRDLRILEQLPIPVYPDKEGRESRWRIDDTYKNRLTVPFSLTEILSLYLAEDSIRSLAGTILYDSLESLFDKVRANLPKPLFRQMVDLRGSFLSAVPAQKDYGVYREVIKVIQEAIQGRKTLHLSYRPLNKALTERWVDPYAVHLHNGTLYLIGYCHMRKDIRFFVVDRMQKIKPTEGSFTMPPGFSLESYLRHSFGMMREDLVRVRLRFHKSLTRYLLERRWHPSQKNKKLKDGSLELAFDIAGTKEIKTWILGFGSLAKALEPASLVKEIKEDLEKSLRSYGRP